ncbi:MAG TPA: radical SAM protein [Candidatus Bathyarchaeia archaeon]|nr:radical SAM protein [Candidatus Bathyarchaeia archaeon]
MPFSSVNLHEKTCSLCKSFSSTISAKLGVCKQCILNNFNEAMKIVANNRLKNRELYNLPAFPPKSKNGVSCGDCVNNCVLAEEELGFCGLVTNKKHLKMRIAGDEKTGGLFSFYHDSLPTNCVAEPFCPGCTSSGYPKYSYTNGPEFGFNNLAVFYQSCTYDCLFCQNYQYRKGIHLATPSPPETLLKAVRKNTSCICFFGGDPSSQIRHSIAVGKLVLEKAKEEKRILRVCWETNGSARPSLMKEATEIALKSGGSIKIDFKAYDDRLVKALCGSSNKFTIYNIRKIGSLIQERSETPLLIVSTLLVPGYIEKDQIKLIAKFLVKINPSIPFSLLAFYPAFVLDDLPTTSRKQAEECFTIAKEVGLENVWIGNKHLLR